MRPQAKCDSIHGFAKPSSMMVLVPNDAEVVKTTNGVAGFQYDVSRTMTTERE